jgi:hypothetical protein
MAGRPGALSRRADTVNKVLDELDNQEIHLRRLARRIDRLTEAKARSELMVSAMLHESFAAVHIAWDENPPGPPGWPEPTTVTISRGRAQADAIIAVAREVEILGGSLSADRIEKELEDGRLRMPFVMEAGINEGPYVVDPQVIARDYFELVFNPQQEALLKIDEALDGLGH